MRFVRLCWIALASTTLASTPLLAQPKAPAKSAATETRYFAALDGLMDGNADVILKEVRQGKALKTANLDVCFVSDRASGLKDRFVVDLAVNGSELTGTTQTLVEKTPVAIKLTRKPTGNTYDFAGQVTIGKTTEQISSADNSDLSEWEFKENRVIEEPLVGTPSRLSEASPESVGIKVKMVSTLSLLQALRAEDVEITLNSLTVSCDELRADTQMVTVNINPERAASFIEKVKTMPGVINAGWTNGSIDMERAVRFSADEWLKDGKIDRAKIATHISQAIGKSLDAKPTASEWDMTTGALNMQFKRPSRIVPQLKLLEIIKLKAIVSPALPVDVSRLLIWVTSPETTTVDETTGPHLKIDSSIAGEDEGNPRDESRLIIDLAAAFQGQRWNLDRDEWEDPAPARARDAAPANAVDTPTTRP